MIEQFPITEFWIDPKRPDIFDDVDRETWNKFHDLVKSSTIPVAVSGAFGFVETVLESKGGYGGGGFDYKFWFKSIDDRDNFLDELDGVLPRWRRLLALQRLIHPQQKPPFGSKRAAALALYQPPFRFEHGFIFDSNNHMVADQGGIGEVEKHIIARVRGWGRIGYMPDAEELQDEVGAVLAEALTEFWKTTEK